MINYTYFLSEKKNVWIILCTVWFGAISFLVFESQPSNNFNCWLWIIKLENLRVEFTFPSLFITEIVVIVGYIVHGRMRWMHPNTNLSTVCKLHLQVYTYFVYFRWVLGLLEFQAEVLVKPEVLNLIRLLGLLEVLGLLQVLALLKVLELLEVLG